MTDPTARMPEANLPQEPTHAQGEHTELIHLAAHEVEHTEHIQTSQDEATQQEHAFSKAQDHLGTARLDDLMATHAPGSITPGKPLELRGIQYTVQKQLGQASGEAVVYLLHDATQAPFVLKYYMPGIRPKEEIIQALIQANHPDIVNVLDYGYYQDRFFELLEYAAGGDLLQYAPIQSPDKIKEIIAETVQALAFCHQNNIVHRDIKPGNIFYKEAQGSNIIIGDFGISSKIAEGDFNKLTSQNRSPIYAAPEIYQSVQGKVVVKKEIDYYSLGITLIYLWTGEVPFKGFSEFQIMDAKVKGQILIPPDMPEDIKHLTRGLLTFNPDKRWGYPEIQRWLAGEHVQVYSLQPEQDFKPFRFGSDPSGQRLEAQNPDELMKLMQAYPEKAQRYLENGSIKSWLEQNGQHDVALDLQERLDRYPRAMSLVVAHYCFQPTRQYVSPAGRACESLLDIANAVAQEEAAYLKEFASDHSELFIYLDHHKHSHLTQQIKAAVQRYPDRPHLAVFTALFLLDPQRPYPFSSEVQIHSPEALADFIYTDDWSVADGPPHYNEALNQLHQGKFLAWLSAIGKDNLVQEYQSQNYHSDDHMLEVFLRLLKPDLPAIRMKWLPPLDTRRHPWGGMLSFEINYETSGPGIPFVKLEAQGNLVCLHEAVAQRQGHISVLVDSSRIKKVDQQHVAELVLHPSYPTEIAGPTTLQIPYRIAYPWKNNALKILKAGILGTSLALALRGSLAYHYPKFLSSYFGYSFTFQQAQGFRDDFMIYCFAGSWVFLLLFFLWFFKRGGFR